MYLIKYTPSHRQERYVMNHDDSHTFIHGIRDKYRNNTTISSMHNHGVKHSDAPRMDNDSIFRPWRSGQIPLHIAHEQMVISNLYLIKYSPPSLIGELLDVFHDGITLEMELQEIHLGIDVEAT